MPGNATPQFTRQGAITAVRITAANTSSEGDGTIGTTNFLVFTADATNGSFIEFVRLTIRATAPTASTGTCIRLFISTQTSGATTSANTNLFAEATYPQQNADSATVATVWVDVPCNFRLPAGQTILATSHNAPAANTSYAAMAIAGDY